MNLLIMGLPGAGKGTQAEMIVQNYGVKHVSTGDMFREAIKNETEMGKLAKGFIDKGELVPDDVTRGVVMERLSKEDIKKNGVLMDGYPRNIDQAIATDEMFAELGLNLDAVINIEVDPSILVDRISGRFICCTCGATYHKLNKLPKVEGVCDICGGHEFYQRDDDKPETVETRIKINEELSTPILEHYRKLGLVKDINGMGGIDDIKSSVKAVLDNL
ncbi:adenylate kinase [Lactovum miscens]|uniref:Adenylate kinase n=1 Tax=Lactovum miscens TaxID=190387 RepID=A0A841CAQ6_9LACT|nr:adenylate kinase [Lactovum miscens]MBB5888479.1 adenylate kinase [Lactovum miscens]